MRITLHIGCDQTFGETLVQSLQSAAQPLAQQGVCFPETNGFSLHKLLHCAASAPDAVIPWRVRRGDLGAKRHAALLRRFHKTMRAEIQRMQPNHMVLAAPQFALELWKQDEISRLAELLGSYAAREDIRIVAHITPPAIALSRHFGLQILAGRRAPLARDLALCASPDWWKAAAATVTAANAERVQMPAYDAAPAWLDYLGLQTRWEQAFGKGTVALHPVAHTDAETLRAALDLPVPLDFDYRPPAQPSAASLTRTRQFRILVDQLLDTAPYHVPPKLMRNMVNMLGVDGPPISADELWQITNRFSGDIAELCARNPRLSPEQLHLPIRSRTPFAETEPGFGFRASQYLAAFLPQIEQATADHNEDQDKPLPLLPLSPAAQRLLPAVAIRAFNRLEGTQFLPHNDLGAPDLTDIETAQSADFPPTTPRVLPDATTPNSGIVIVASLKNEAPYILEWIAHHRMVGVDNFVIYTNDCEDGTAEILDRLDRLGIVEHRPNNRWKGDSPQMHALGIAPKEPLIRMADWIIHIDVDEFINVRCGNGTLQDFLARVPDATNIAMPWRLFGNNGVARISDRLVTESFIRCAPKFCPKPHTVWGIKTMTKNIGAYSKIGCHRPNGLTAERAQDVLWVNGSGQDVTRELRDRGWRNSRKTVGYDLIQLNHYALRSADSYLVKRQRGRALHVNRSIGFSYWVRMDWNDHLDLSIQRNLNRVRAQMDRLMADPILRDLHEKGLDWHQQKAAELRTTPEFEQLYQQIQGLTLTARERVAFMAALDMES